MQIFEIYFWDRDWGDIGIALPFGHSGEGLVEQVQGGTIRRKSQCRREVS